jgi:hypothetical protein
MKAPDERSETERKHRAHAEAVRREAPAPELAVGEVTPTALQRAAGNRATAEVLVAAPAALARLAVQRQAKAPSLLTGELELDPEIRAKMRAIELTSEFLQPEVVKRGVLDLSVSTPPPSALTLPIEAAPEPEPLVPRGKGPPTARAATMDDFTSAVTSIPAFERIIERLKVQAMERLRHDWSQLRAGEKAAVLTVTGVIAGTALGGALADPGMRDLLLEQISGRDLPIPGLSGLTMQVNRQRSGVEVMLTLDVGRLFPSSFGFK